MTTASSRPWYSILYIQVLIAIALGIVLGHYFPDTGKALKPLGDGFIALIKMMIAPVIFCTVVHGIGSMRDLKKVGRVGVKTLFYFEAVSTLALAIGLVVGKLLQPGKGFDIVISRWEGERDVGRLNKVMAHPVALGEEFEDQPRLIRRVLRNIPAIDARAPDPAIARCGESAVNTQVFGDILNQDQPRAPVRKLKSCKHFKFMTLDVNRQKIKRRGRLGFSQNLVERLCRDLDLAG
jgi:hypothetical protein